jgi:hypothetical protein
VPVPGARADGLTVDTAVVQAALDQAAKAWRKVHLPAARYLVKGSLRIPPGATLQGVNESPVWSEPLKGSIILARGGRDQQDGPALFELGHFAAVRGLTVFYPEQKVTNTPATLRLDRWCAAGCPHPARRCAVDGKVPL